MPEGTALPLRVAWREVARLAPRHRRQLVVGGVLTIFSVCAQLSIPWPLKELFKGSPDAPWRAALPAWLSAGIAMGTLFFVVMALAGLFDYLQRVAFARFAIGWARDLRAATHSAAERAAHSGTESLHRGDLVARLIGDVARFKASVKVTLVYVASNGLLFLSGCVIVWSIAPLFGIVFSLGFLTSVVVALFGARRSYRDFAGYREEEGRLATSLSSGETMSAEELGRSAEFEASEVRQQSGAAWAAHGIMGAMVASILVLGQRGSSAGTVSDDALLLFLGYALFLSKPLVRLTRHGARVGKLVAGGLRLGTFLAEAHAQTDTTVARPERTVEVVVPGGPSACWPARGLVRLPAEGAAALALGISGEGEGCTVRWDGVPVSRSELSSSVRFVGRHNLWSTTGLEDLVTRLSAGPFGDCLEGLGVTELARRRAGLGVASGEVCTGEAAGMALALAADEEVPIVVLSRVDVVLDEEGLRALESWCSAARSQALVLVRSPDADFLRRLGLELDG